MSIDECIEQLITSRKLNPLSPTISGEVCLRTVLVTERIQEYLNQDVSLPKKFRRTAIESRLVIDRFLAPKTPTTVGLAPYNSPSFTVLALLDHGFITVWEFRVRDPNPQVRIFGCFAQKDTFIALTYGNRDTLDFSQKNAETRRIWKALFKQLPSVQGDKIDEYLSEKYKIVRTSRKRGH